ncbi:uncharacterized protein LY89DRAFT_600644 [Mollisia scopiformis]|uniref:FAM192A/Fyv6 N-terminal domain-containing protein n=1 Tax=Mollisia scopiformis TaxID=149040 RepID=A0A132B8F1_MOLSC|nr:uncharacterized protein LY89DRAFT_600644 [Mollisia scopiformis]KUJ07947.1 hypothetical protein LY89DRAFT_600644 [Mollisia scopiformis]
MSSGFVSGGTIEEPIERDEAWLAAQKEVEANHRRKAELARQNNGKSLFETLEANKAAKQEAFEEAAKLKHQFQSLNEDEAEFLDSILERTRAEEDRVKKETQEGLALFRQQQEEVDKKARRGSDGAAVADTPAEDESWAAGRKRKRAKEKEGLKGVKLRRSSTTEAMNPPQASPTTRAQATTNSTATKDPVVKTDPKPPSVADKTKSQDQPEASSNEKKTPIPSKGALGLVDYGSDEEDDW